MTDAQHGAAPTAPLDTSARRRNLTVILLLTVGALAVVGGLVGALSAKASADYALLVASFPRTLSVHAFGGYLFPAAHSIVPDYSSLWIGVVVAVLGMIVLLTGVIVASARTSAA